MAEVIGIVLAFILIALFFVLFGIYTWLMAPLLWDIHRERKAARSRK